MNASPARTAAVAASGGKTQVTGLFAAGALCLLVPAVGLLRDLPLAALSAVLIFVASRILHLKDFVAIARFDLFELGLALVTLLAVAFVGVEQGIGVAIALAVIDRIRLSIQPHLHILGRVPNTTSWVPNDVGDPVKEIPGVLVVLFATPLWYANAVRFRDQLMAVVQAQPAGLRLIVLDVVGMSDLDFTGASALGHVLNELKSRGVTIAFARAGRRVEIGLERSGILADLGRDHLFSSVDEAIRVLST